MPRAGDVAADGFGKPDEGHHVVGVGGQPDFRVGGVDGVLHPHRWGPLRPWGRGNVAAGSKGKKRQDGHRYMYL